MTNKQIDVDARKIANEIVFGEIGTASKMWRNSTLNLRTFEVIALRDKIRSIEGELQAAKTDLKHKRNGF